MLTPINHINPVPKIVSLENHLVGRPAPGEITTVIKGTALLSLTQWNFCFSWLDMRVWRLLGFLGSFPAASGSTSLVGSFIVHDTCWYAVLSFGAMWSLLRATWEDRPSCCANTDVRIYSSGFPDGPLLYCRKIAQGMNLAERIRYTINPATRALLLVASAPSDRITRIDMPRISAVFFPSTGRSKDAQENIAFGVQEEQGCVCGCALYGEETGFRRDLHSTRGQWPTSVNYLILLILLVVLTVRCLLPSENRASATFVT